MDVSIGLRQILVWLLGKTNAVAQALFWGIVFAVAFAIDRSDILKISIVDLFDAPDLLGPRGRLLKISQAKKSKVAKMAAKGDLFKSGHFVMQGLKRFGKSIEGKNDRGGSRNKIVRGKESTTKKFLK